MMKAKLKDRIEAARLLESELENYKANKDVVVMAIYEGGVPLGYHLAKKLKVSFDIVPCKKLDHPAKKGKIIGSVTIDEITTHDDADIPCDYIYHQVRQIQNELKNRYKHYRGDKLPLELKEKIVILVDDHLKTKDSMMVCLRSIKKQAPAKIIVAVPVSTVAASQQIMPEVDDFICLIKSFDHDSADNIYENQPTASDEEVKYLLNLA